MPFYFKSYFLETAILRNPLLAPQKRSIQQGARHDTSFLNNEKDPSYKKKDSAHIPFVASLLVCFLLRHQTYEHSLQLYNVFVPPTRDCNDGLALHNILPSLSSSADRALPLLHWSLSLHLLLRLPWELLTDVHEGSTTPSSTSHSALPAAACPTKVSALGAREDTVKE